MQTTSHSIQWSNGHCHGSNAKSRYCLFESACGRSTYDTFLSRKEINCTTIPGILRHPGQAPIKPADWTTIRLRPMHNITNPERRHATAATYIKSRTHNVCRSVYTVEDSPSHISNQIQSGHYLGIFLIQHIHTIPSHINGRHRFFRDDYLVNFDKHNVNIFRAF